MNRRALPTAARSRVLAAATLTLVGGGVVLAAAPARADTVPYTDYAVKGAIGLCDDKGAPVTGGSIYQRPFVWRAVGTVAAPAPYDGTGRGAQLVAYQPRSNAYPNQWSGDTLTAASNYSDASAPTVQATGDDESLAQFISQFPLQADGMIQLRMYYGVPGQPTENSEYAATDIKVTGSTWTVVRGATVPCDKGTATSTEVWAAKVAGQSAPATTAAQASASAAAKARASASSATGKPSAAASGAASHGSPAATSAGGTAGATSSTATRAAASTASTASAAVAASASAGPPSSPRTVAATPAASSRSAGNAAVWIVAAALVVIAAAVGVVRFRRAHRP